MKRGHRKRRWGKWLIRGTLGVLALLLIVGVGGWLAIARVPSWYVPVEVSHADLTRVRNSLPNTYQAVNERIIAGEAFEFSIPERLVSEWIVARGELYPEAHGWLPDWLRDPVVSFQDGHCVVGARIDYRGWQTILGIHLEVECSADEVRVRVARLTAGSVPIPLTRLTGPLQELLASPRLDPDLMPDPGAEIVRRLRSQGADRLIREGVSWRNLFRTRNGRRVFKLTGVDPRDGQLTLRVLESRDSLSSAEAIALGACISPLETN
jgi:hypothetical protein